MQGSTKFAFKTSPFQVSSLSLNIVLEFIIMIIILCIDDRIDQKSFSKKMFFKYLLFTYKLLHSKFINKKTEAIYFLIFSLMSVCLSFYLKKHGS